MNFLAITSFFAAVVNGALGYGFSSITVPIALLFLANKTLNPAIVVVEVFLNLMVLYVNRKSFRLIWPHLKTIILAMIPSIALGGYLLTTVNPHWVKLGTYLVLLPLLLCQVMGIRRPVNIRRAFGIFFGLGLGFLYSLTTISGPPLALLFNNQGLDKEEFRVALATIRAFEAVITTGVYLVFGLFTFESLSLLPYMLPFVLIGIPLGAKIIARMDSEIFRRICMSFDIALVGYGLVRTILELKIMNQISAYLILGLLICLEAALVYKFFSNRTCCKPSE